MRSLATLMILLIISNLGYADCPNAVNLPKGSTVTDCDRIGYSVPYDTTVRTEILENDVNKKRVENLQIDLNIKDQINKDSAQQGELWQQEYQKEKKARQDEENRTHWEFYGGIALGALAVFLGGLAIHSAAH